VLSYSDGFSSSVIIVGAHPLVFSWYRVYFSDAKIIDFSSLSLKNRDRETKGRYVYHGIKLKYFKKS
jgi:hypothetical protein